MFFSHMNLNKVSMKHQLYPKSRKIHAFGHEIHFCHNPGHDYYMRVRVLDGISLYYAHLSLYQSQENSSCFLYRNNLKVSFT